MRGKGWWLGLGIGGLLLLSPVNTQSDKSQQKQQLQQQLTNLKGRIGQLRSQIQQKKREERKVRRDIAELDAQIDNTTHRLHQTRTRLANARQEQRSLAKQLAILTARLQKRQALLAQRLRAAYKHRSISYLNVLLGARSMRELTSRSYVMRQIVKADKELLDAVRADQQAVAQAKARMDRLVVQIGGLERDLHAQAAELREAQQEKKLTLKQIASERALYERQLAELEAESRAIARRLRAMMETPAGRARADKRWSGRFIRPVNGRISSGYGMRTHPIFRVRRMHHGIDIAAPHGTPIVAADSGVVVEAGYIRGYGNTVIIDHGGGVATLYAHCSTILVRVGQEVQRGQMIARVGSTGYTTGPHLHFEIRINGDPVNPAEYGF
jgi:murein DD-endopeptidase MepM/ murein hydrolase activator NlpD